MNITKTEMLLLNNRIQKDDANEKNGDKAPVTATIEPKEGMKELTFQGMQNLMANPALAQKVGMTNSDLSFKAMPMLNVAKKIVPLGFAAMLGLGLTSCEKDDPKITSEPVHITSETNVTQTVTVNNSDLIKALTTQFQAQNNILLQMLMNQQISYEEYNKLLQQNNALLAKLSGQVDYLSGQVEGLSGQLTEITGILSVVAGNTFDIKNGVNAIYDENNIFHQSAIAILTQAGYSREEAIRIFNSLYAEVVAHGKDETEAYTELIRLAKERNEKLDTLISQGNAAFDQRNKEIEYLNRLCITGEATEEAVKALNISITATNNSLVAIGNRLLKQLKEMNANNTYWYSTIAYLAQQNNCSIQEMTALLQSLNINVENLNNVTSEQLAVLIEGVTNAINYQTTVISGFQNDVDNYANLALQELQGLRAQICSFMSLVAKYGNAAINNMVDMKNLIKQGNCKLDNLVNNTNDTNIKIDQYNVLMAQLNEYVKIISQKDGGMTAAQFKQILKEQRVEDYNFLTNLLANLNIPATEFDTQPIEVLLAEISAKLNYFSQGVEIWNKILVLCQQYPDKLDKIYTAIIEKEFIHNCCCQEDVNHDENVHEGIKNDLENMMQSRKYKS